LNKPQKPVKTTPARRKPSNQQMNTMEEIQNLTEEQAKLLLQYAVEDLDLMIAMPAPEIDSKRLQWLTDKIKTLSKENTEK
jgi:hypothetical protein